MPSLYCFKLKGITRNDNKDVYKFGKTNQPNAMTRINSYSGLNKPRKIFHTPQLNSSSAEFPNSSHQEFPIFLMLAIFFLLLSSNLLFTLPRGEFTLR